MPSVLEKPFQPSGDTGPEPIRFGSAIRFDLGGRAHFVGIGGAGMRSLAAVLHEDGWAITGSDSAAVDASDYPFPVTSGHARRNVPETSHYLIHSDAVQPANEELTVAGNLGIPKKSYFQALGELMRDRLGVAIAGTHGKSTVTAMTAHCLVHAGLDPTVVFGAAPLDSRHGGRLGRGQVMLVEACEYRRNFLQLSPQMGVILGIEPDHFDCFPTAESLDAAFSEFAANLPGDGLLLVRHGCPRARRAAEGTVCPTETFGSSVEADWRYRIEEVIRGFCTISITRGGTPILTARLRVPGRHSALNATAAAALAINLGASVRTVRGALEDFGGICRRLERVTCINNIVFWDDFAHHPTEVRSTLETVREMEPDRRLICVFQPHQASRTAALLDETATALQNVDRLALTPIVRAREGPSRAGDVTSHDLAVAVRRRGRTVDAVLGENTIENYFSRTLREGDCVLAMGAGNIGSKLREAISRLQDEANPVCC